MPSLKSDESVPASVWRGRTHNGDFSLKKYHENNIKEGITTYLNTVQPNMVLPTVLGVRDGTAHNQSALDSMHQKIQLQPYAGTNAKSPFLSDSVEDMYPRVYGVNPIGGTNRELLTLASIGGSPLAIALDTVNEVDNRMYNERLRMDPRNPLSGAFAKRVFQMKAQQEANGDLPPMSGIMNTELENTHLKRHMYNSRVAAGYNDSFKEGTEQRKYLDKLYNQTRKPTAQDLLDFKDLMKVNRLPDENNLKADEQKKDARIGALDVSGPAQIADSSIQQNGNFGKNADFIDTLSKTVGRSRASQLEDEWFGRKTYSGGYSDLVDSVEQTYEGLGSGSTPRAGGKSRRGKAIVRQRMEQARLTDEIYTPPKTRRGTVYGKGVFKTPKKYSNDL